MALMHVLKNPILSLQLQCGTCKEVTVFVLFSHYVIVIVSVFVICGVVRVWKRIIRVLKRERRYTQVICTGNLRAMALPMTVGAWSMIHDVNAIVILLPWNQTN